MAITDTFDLFTDSGLTTPFSGTLTLTHYTDLSDNPQDTTLYLGSTNSNRKLQADSNPGTDNMTLTPTDGITDWATSTAYSSGDRVEPTTPNGYVYECTTAGTSDASTEPTWPTTGIGSSTVNDGTVTWTLLSARHELTEIKLALTSGGLSGATAGAALNIGTTINGGTGNAQEIHIRVTNAVTNVSDTTGYAEITLDTNTLLETIL